MIRRENEQGGRATSVERQAPRRLWVYPINRQRPSIDAEVPVPIEQFAFARS
jgi:hypothetical protein